MILYAFILLLNLIKTIFFHELMFLLLLDYSHSSDLGLIINFRDKIVCFYKFYLIIQNNQPLKLSFTSHTRCSFLLDFRGFLFRCSFRLGWCSGLLRGLGSLFLLFRSPKNQQIISSMFFSTFEKNELK